MSCCEFPPDVRSHCNKWKKFTLPNAVVVWLLFGVVIGGNVSGQVAVQSADEPKVTSTMRLEDAVETVRRQLKISKNGWKLKAFLSNNSEYTVVHDTHSIGSNGWHTWGDNLALLDASNNVLWAKSIKYHWPVVVGDEGTIALAQWEERGEAIIRSKMPGYKDGLDVKLFDKTGRELAACPIGRLLATNKSLQMWVFKERTLFAGAFGPGDKCFYFATRASSSEYQPQLKPELHCLRRDGELVWRGRTGDVFPHRLLAYQGSVSILGETDEKGETPFVQFETESFEIEASGKFPKDYRIPCSISMIHTLGGIDRVVSHTRNDDYDANHLLAYVDDFAGDERWKLELHRQHFGQLHD